MDDSLNRAVSHRSRGMLAVCLSAFVAGNVQSSEPQTWNRIPGRITSPSEISGHVQQTSALRPQDGKRVPQFVREPGAEVAPREMTTRSTPSNWSDFNAHPIKQPASALPVPTSRSSTLIAPHSTANEQSTAINTEISNASVMQLFAEPEQDLLQTVARREKAVRNELALASADSSAILYAMKRSPQVLPGFSIGALRQSAAKSLDDAAISLTHRANLSGAAAATEALRRIAESIDLQRGDKLASNDLAAALLALDEAEDFVGRYGTVDSVAIARMIRAHETVALKGFDTTNLTGMGAADVYMDFTRQTMGAIALADPLASHAVGLLAKSYRQRANESPLALAASVHLMRAAASASPNDRGLAIELASVLKDANLVEESDVILAHASQLPESTQSGIDFGLAGKVEVTKGVAIEATGTRHALQVEQLSPEAFASISRSEAGPIGNQLATSTVFTGETESSGPSGSNAATTKPNKAVSSQSMYSSPAVDGEPENKTNGNPVSRAFKSMSKVWR